jgi:hypothetical protein
MSTVESSQSSRDRAVGIYEFTSIVILIVNSLIRYSIPTIRNIVIISVIIAINLFYQWKAVKKNVTSPNLFVTAIRTFRLSVNTVLILFLLSTTLLEEANKNIDKWNKQAEKIAVEHLKGIHTNAESLNSDCITLTSKINKKDLHDHSFAVLYNENGILKYIDGSSAIATIIIDFTLVFNMYVVYPLIVLFLILVIVAIPIDWLAYWQLEGVNHE